MYSVVFKIKTENRLAFTPEFHTEGKGSLEVPRLLVTWILVKSHRGFPESRTIALNDWSIDGGLIGVIDPLPYRFQ